MKELELPRLTRTALSNQALNALRQAITSGQLRPGQWLVESTIAKRFQISRGPLREALRRLEQEGLVTTIPNKGTRVTVLSNEDIRELHALRALLEGFAVRQLCQRDATDQPIARLEETLAQMRATVEAQDMASFSQLDFEFHEAIVSAAAMRRLASLWHSLNGLLMIWLLSVQDAVRQCLPDVLDDHECITSALKARDAEMAERLLREHILDRGEQVLRLAQDASDRPGS